MAPTPRKAKNSTGPTAHPRSRPKTQRNDLLPPSEFGTRLRTYREERGLSLSGLADRTGLSKGYLSSLENNHEPRRPSADVLYTLANELGVTMSDLMGRRLLTSPSESVPESLVEFAKQDGLNQADVAMLASIQFRGEQPRTASRWRYIYQSIRNSQQMDDLA